MLGEGGQASHCLPTLARFKGLGVKGPAAGNCNGSQEQQRNLRAHADVTFACLLSSCADLHLHRVPSRDPPTSLPYLHAKDKLRLSARAVTLTLPVCISPMHRAKCCRASVQLRCQPSSPAASGHRRQNNPFGHQSVISSCQSRNTAG